MRRLATALESAFDSSDSSQSGTAAAQPPAAVAAANGHRDVPSDLPDSWPERPIARVNSVAPGSPAADAVSGI